MQYTPLDKSLTYAVDSFVDGRTVRVKTQIRAVGLRAIKIRATLRTITMLADSATTGGQIRTMAIFRSVKRKMRGRENHTGAVRFVGISSRF